MKRVEIENKRDSMIRMNYLFDCSICVGEEMFSMNDKRSMKKRKTRLNLKLCQISDKNIRKNFLQENDLLEN